MHLSLFFRYMGHIGCVGPSQRKSLQKVVWISRWPSCFTQFGRMWAVSSHAFRDFWREKTTHSKQHCFLCLFDIVWRGWNMGVSKNKGTPKWMVYNGKPYQNGYFRGTPIFGNTHIEPKRFGYFRGFFNSVSSFCCNWNPLFVDGWISGFSRIVVYLEFQPHMLENLFSAVGLSIQSPSAATGICFPNNNFQSDQIWIAHLSLPNKMH